MMRFLVAAPLVLLGACSSDPDVPADVQQRVDVFVEDGNCRGLQAEFDNADDSEVMRYIDGQMRDAGCY
ncbi:MAG TPA: hypothetical protein VJ782_05120 [Aeromicrobium sp.]|nr:hypothetical protein [Aeromicrobium sp.]